MWYVVVGKIFAGRPRLAARLVGFGVHGTKSGSSEVSIEEAFVGRKAFVGPGQTHTEVLDVLAVRSVVRLQSSTFAGLVSMLKTKKKVDQFSSVADIQMYHKRTSTSNTSETRNINSLKLVLTNA